MAESYASLERKIDEVLRRLDESGAGTVASKTGLKSALSTGELYEGVATSPMVRSWDNSIGESCHPTVAAILRYIAKFLWAQLTWWNSSYLLDYMAMFIAVIFIALQNDYYILEQKKWYPEKDQWDYNQIRRTDTVPWTSEVVPAMVCSLVVVCFFANLRRPSLHDIHNFTCGALTVFFTYTWIYLMARAFGRPRPMLLSKCDPIYDTNQTPPDYYIIGCQNPNYDEWEWASLVSGHVCFPTAEYAFITFYIIGKANPWRNGGLAFVYLFLWPGLTYCAWIAFSRVYDNVHHWSDVCNSFVIGVLVGLSSYLLYFPNPFMELKYKPYNPRLRAGTYANPGPTNIFEYMLVKFKRKEKEGQPDLIELRGQSPKNELEELGDAQLQSSISSSELSKSLSDL